MKKCCVCKQEKELKDFHIKSSSVDGRQNVCKNCNTKRAGEYYRTNNLKKKFSARAEQYKRQLRNKLNFFKESVGCSFCNEKDECCLDFHHPDNSIKEGTVCGWILRKSKRKAIQEIAKCILVCSNCHRKIHYGKLDDKSVVTIGINQAESIFE